MRVYLKHGTAKIPVEADDASTLSDLMDVVQRETEVPTNGQKLILNGKTLTSLDHGRTLKECGLVPNCKVMVLGKRYDPEADEAYKRVVEVEGKSLEVNRRLTEAAKEIKDIEDGYLAREHHAQALKALSKRCRGATEEFMRLLEQLDSISVGGSASSGDGARHKRKSVVNDINACLDRAERLVANLEQMQQDAASSAKCSSSS